jgi:hypothetical protein
MSAAAALVVVAGLAYRVGPHVWNERSAVSEKAEQSVAAPATSAPQKPAADAALQPAPPSAPASPAETNIAPSRQTAPAAGSAMPKFDAARARGEDKASGELRKQENQTPAIAGYAAQPAQSKPVHTAGKQTARDSVEAETAPADAVQVQSEIQMKSTASPPRIDAAPAPPAEPVVAAPESLSVASPAPEQKGKQQASPTAFPAAPTTAHAPAPPSPAATVAPAPMRETAPTAVDVEMKLYPEHWISDIRRMIKDGHRNDAIKNLEAFRKRYPDYTLPDDLRDLK